jgi:dTDP-4-dehydrorhamnose reductase
MRILVTGASGLLGLNLALEAARLGHTVYGAVNRNALRSQAFTVVECDLLAPGAVERLIDETRPDWVIHCAALALVDACEAQPELARELNSEVPAKLAQYVARGGARLVHLSTDAVFDGSRGDYTEEDAPHPLGVYSRTKLESERRVAAADPGAIIARVNLFGWSLRGDRSLSEFFYYNLSAGRPVQGFTDVYFCPLLANHLALVLLQMLAKGLSGLYHVVSPECLSKYEFGLRLARKFGLDEGLIAPVSVAEGGLKAVRSPNLTLRIDKLTRDLGAPPPGISAGLDELYRLYREGYSQFLKILVKRE